MERWFHALDQRRIGGVSGWVAQVCGIHTYGRRLWIQIAAAEDPWRAFVLEVGALTTIEQAVTALEAQSVGEGDGRSYPRLVHIVPGV